MKDFCPHNYQQYCIDRIIRDPALGLFLDMGLGKTAITLTAIKDNRGKTVRAIGLVENVTSEKELDLKLNDGKTAGQS